MFDICTNSQLEIPLGFTGLLSPTFVRGPVRSKSILYFPGPFQPSEYRRVIWGICIGPDLSLTGKVPHPPWFCVISVWVWGLRHGTSYYTCSFVNAIRLDCLELFDDEWNFDCVESFSDFRKKTMCFIHFVSNRIFTGFCRITFQCEANISG